MYREERPCEGALIRRLFGSFYSGYRHHPVDRQMRHEHGRFAGEEAAPLHALTAEKATACIFGRNVAITTNHQIGVGRSLQFRHEGDRRRLKIPHGATSSKRPLQIPNSIQ